MSINQARNNVGFKKKICMIKHGCLKICEAQFRQILEVEIYFLWKIMNLLKVFMVVTDVRV